MKVDIYITTAFKGRFQSGTGAYGIMLQTIKKGEPATRDHYAGWRGISRQKLNVRAAAEAIQYINTPCDVVVHTDSPYIKYVIENGNTNGKFSGLWSAFLEAERNMKSVKAEVERKHEYTSYLKGKLAEGNYVVINDR